MKKLIIILSVIAISCSKQSMSPIDGIWKIKNAQVLYQKLGYIKFENNDHYEGNGTTLWTKSGTFTITGKVFTFTSNTGYVRNLNMYASNDTIIFRDVNYKFNYPKGGEPKDILIRK